MVTTALPTRRCWGCRKRISSSCSQRISSSIWTPGKSSPEKCICCSRISKYDGGTRSPRPRASTHSADKCSRSVYYITTRLLPSATGFRRASRSLSATLCRKSINSALVISPLSSVSEDSSKCTVIVSADVWSWHIENEAMAGFYRFSIFLLVITQLSQSPQRDWELGVCWLMGLKVRNIGREASFNLELWDRLDQLRSVRIWCDDSDRVWHGEEIQEWYLWSMIEMERESIRPIHKHVEFRS